MIPKFRAWDKANKKMYKVTSINYALGYVTGYNGGQKRLFFKDCPVMQSTGLKDKNGKEIFDGDIVSCYIDFPGVGWYDTGEWEGNITDVVKKENNGMFVVSNYSLIDYATEIEVIGNIYENKELLEV